MMIHVNMPWTVQQRQSSYARTPVRYGMQGVNGDYITVTEVARRFRKTKQHVRYLIRKRLLPAIKIADMWLIKRSDAQDRWTV